jgi:hypothetical protein
VRWAPAPVVTETLKQRTQWVAPPDGWMKVNVDGSFVEQSGEAGVGVAVRNHRGDVVLTAWRCCSDVDRLMKPRRLRPALKDSEWCPNGVRDLPSLSRIVREL